MLHEVKLVVNAREDFSNRLRHGFSIGKQNRMKKPVRSFERKLGSWDIMTPTLSWHLSQTTRHRGVGDHAAGTHHLGQIATGNDGRRLIVDAALEASGAPGLNVTQAAREEFAAWNSWECTMLVWWTLCSLTLGWNKPKHQKEQDSESCLSSQ